MELNKKVNVSGKLKNNNRQRHIAERLEQFFWLGLSF
jgi:hypothetical protein